MKKIKLNYSKINNKNGFTIIELVISLSLFLIILTILSSSVKILEKRQLYNCALKLKNDIKYVQKIANIENTEYTILFSIEDNFYEIEKSLENNEKIIKKVYLKNIVKEYLTTAKGNELKFTSKGITYTPCSITLISKNYYIKLTINLGAGRVKIDDTKKLKKNLHKINNY